MQEYARAQVQLRDILVELVIDEIDQAALTGNTSRGGSNAWRESTTTSSIFESLVVGRSTTNTGARKYGSPAKRAAARSSRPGRSPI